MVTLEPFMVGDIPLYVCSGKNGCGALVRYRHFSEHVEFHLRIVGLMAQVSGGAVEATA